MEINGGVRGACDESVGFQVAQLRNVYEICLILIMMQDKFVEVENHS